MKTKDKKVKIEITYKRKYTINKIIEVSKHTADRLLALDGQSSIAERWGKYSSDDTDNISSDNFTMIAEDLTSIHDVIDANNEIEDVQITIAS